MKKNVHKILSLVLITSAFMTQAQDITENFQSWTETNTKTPPTSDAAGTCDKVTTDGVTDSPGHSFVVAPIPDINITETYGTTTLAYKIANGAILPTCNAKIYYKSTTSPSGPVTSGVSVGYIELNKNTTAATTDIGGSVTISGFSYIESISVSLSGTSSSRHATVDYSTDGGTTWINVIDNSTIGKAGNVVTATIGASNVILKVNAFEQIIRLHDLLVYTTTTAVNDLFINGTATVQVENNTVKVQSQESGILEIIDMKGAVVTTNAIAANQDISVNIPATGMFFVRLVTDHQAATQKIVIK